MGGATLIESRPGRIPYRDIRGWAEDYGIVGSAFDTLLAFLDRLDDGFLEWEAERARERAAARG